jgi:RNA polymerase sigma factor (sigma-70 family)
MNGSEHDDAELLRRLGAGDVGATRLLYQRHGARILRFAFTMTTSLQAAEDVVQDTFMELLRTPVRFDGSQGSAISYLLGIAKHRVFRTLRAGWRGVEVRADYEDLATHAGDAGVSQEDHIDSNLLVETVRKAVHGLPPVHREVIALCDLEELPYATVAEVLACPVGTVRSRLHRARAMLAIRLNALGLARHYEAQLITAEPVRRSAP